MMNTAFLKVAKFVLVILAIADFSISYSSMIGANNYPLTLELKETLYRLLLLPISKSSSVNYLVLDLNITFFFYGKSFIDSGNT